MSSWKVRNSVVLPDQETPEFGLSVQEALSGEGPPLMMGDEPGEELQPLAPPAAEPAVEVAYTGLVLAAGRNTRLKGIVPSYHKPLVVVNGRPLIVSIVANLQRHCRNVVVVVSPMNCAVICEILTDAGLLNGPCPVAIVVQPAAQGPGEAAFRGLAAATGNRTILVCADNVIPSQDIQTCLELDRAKASSSESSLTGTLTMSVFSTWDAGEAERFTRVGKDTSGQWRFIESQPGGHDEEGRYVCWVGPLIFNTELGRGCFRNEVYAQVEREAKISLAFNIVADLDVQLIPGTSVDIGTPDALVKA